MTKDFVKAILKSVKLNAEEFYTADDHELVINFSGVSNLEAIVGKLEKLGIPKERIRMAMIIETDEPIYKDID